MVCRIKISSSYKSTKDCESRLGKIALLILGKSSGKNNGEDKELYKKSILTLSKARELGEQRQGVRTDELVTKL